MFKNKNFRRNGFIKYSISDHFFQYKWFYLLFISICLIGIVLGFVVGFNKAENFSLNDLPDTVLVSFINKSISPASMFFSRIFAFLGFFLLIWCLNVKGYLCWISFLIFLYQSFLIGINCALLISLYKFLGVVNVVLVFLPVHLVCLCLLIVWGVVCFSQCQKQKYNGYSVFNACFLKDKILIFLVILLSSIICYLIECLCLPHLVKTLLISVN